MGHDVVCLGEALVDFLPNRRGQRVREVTNWTPCLGGAPANVAVGVSRLGGRSALVGVTGDDEFGAFLREGLKAEGVDVRHLRQTPEGKTGLGFVSLTKSGERSFTFYRTRAAETFLSPQDTRRARGVLANATILHAGTNSLLQPEAREAVVGAIRSRYLSGKLVSLDPNLRLHLWKQPRVLQSLLRELFPMCAIVKLSEEEIHFATGTREPEVALKRLERLGVMLPVVTLGAKGAIYRFHGETGQVPAPRVKVVDTTGAGDGFMAALLVDFTGEFDSREALQAASIDTLTPLMRFACVVGSKVVQKLGAVRGLPHRS